ncbi:hypothetical protein J5N97_000117 [Dioscorea zingiberensis]|uniref:Cytochrome b5 heme-binding domain-containing protein n=1 Tax=Dioscorea zingiberensis TaxID=325984 RepID=A0A9D5BST1_9LILI|nr:hypothetical protein J5N97_000117 [Dioscorea zingiberensis]
MIGICLCLGDGVGDDGSAGRIPTEGDGRREGEEVIDRLLASCFCSMSIYCTAKLGLSLGLVSIWGEKQRWVVEFDRNRIGGLRKEKVYDVTKFLDDHPGGDDVLLSATGKDATDDFEDVGHSDNARDMLKDFYVGEIDASTIPKKTTYTPPKQPQYNQDKTSEFIIKLLQFLVPIAILGLAFGIRLYAKSS